MQNKGTRLAHSAFVFLLAGILTVVGCGKGEAPPQGGAPVVSVVTVGTDSVTLTTELAGRTVPCRTAEIRPQVNGLILKRNFTEGNEVEEGQSLYTIDPEPYRATLENAQAALARTEANLTSIRLRKERVEGLLPSHAVSQQDYDDAVSGLKQAEAEVASWKAQVKTARINLDRTEVRAPITGRIGRSLVTEGAIVVAYQPQALAVIQQLDPIYVDMPQSATEMLRLQRRLADGSLHALGSGRDNVQAVMEDGATYDHPGTLEFRDVSVDPTTGSVVLRAIFPNPRTRLLPDMFVRGVVTEGVDRDAVLIPQQAVARNAKGEPYCWIVDEQSQAQLRPLTIGRAVDSRWLVNSGLQAGETLVVEGVQYLRRSGMPVQTKPWSPEGDIEAPAEGESADSAQAH